MGSPHKAVGLIFTITAIAGCSSGPAASGVSPAALGSALRPPSVLEPASGGGPLFPLRSVNPLPVHRVEAPASAASGVYVSEYVSSVVYGFSHKKRSQKKKGPICTAPWKMSGPQYVSVDGKGNLLEVDSGALYPINIGQGPGMCGALAATIQDRQGYADAVASFDALNGIVAIANQWDFSNYGFAPGSISVCTVASGCTANLTNAAMYRVAGVAIDAQGDCWASAFNSPDSGATLTYFQGCSGPGQQATGYQNPGYGSLDVDSRGNLVAMSYVISSYKTTLYVYSGCKPACQLVGGPFTLHGSTTSGHLNAASTKFAAADPQAGTVDIYSYSPAKVTYLYSIKKGLSQIDDVTGVAFNPASSQ